MRTALRTLWMCACVTLLALMLLPLIRGTCQSVGSLWSILGMVQLHIVVNTLLLAMSSTLVCTSIGVACAVVLHSLHPRLGAAMLIVLTLPLLLPPMVVTIALHTAFGGASELAWKLTWLTERPLMAALLVSSVCYTPLVVWIVAMGCRRRLTAQEQHALLYMPRYRVLWNITLPGLRRHIGVSALLVFLLTTQGFDICHIVGLHTLVTDVYIQAMSATTSTQVFATAAPVLLIGWLVAGAVAWLVRLQPPESDQPRPERNSTAHVASAHWVLVLFLVPTLIAPALVLWNLCAVASAVESPLDLWQDASQGLVNSGVFSLLAAVSLPIMATLLIPALLHKCVLVRRTCLFVLLAILATPSSVYSLCLLDMANALNLHGLPEVIAGRSRIFAVLAVRGLPLASIVICTGVLRRPRQGEQLAAVFSVRGWRHFRHLRWHWVGEHVLMASVLGFVFCMRELELYVLHCPPGATTITVHILNAVHFGAPERTAGLCLLLAFASASPMLLLLGKRQ